MLKSNSRSCREAVYIYMYVSAPIHEHCGPGRPPAIACAQALAGRESNYLSVCCGPGRSRTACLFIANEAFNQVNFGPFPTQGDP